ncbi:MULTISPECIES: NB-ARC domain-containing protein [unclassified Dolichospermum]|uniref:NB-ARC domain-containing protein n=1 Tax=unclassified Dolichospermum TaxID=2622029 RepID=UPI001445142E|nr:MULTISPECIES: NB-ARC domain-containing protein [unclassified Dolichospermum]MTJ19622.1 AAA family ATPase [Dolichospermum sp. UHCC 0299]MTJ39276.1 AAA family ATPase [Dolichospermum sp. UHCC 0406]
MDVNDVLQFVDGLMVERTGKHLDDLQKAVIVGTWERQTYEDIAQQYRFNKNYVGDVGAGLWQLLSQQLGEDINKRNFRSTIERLRLNQPAFIIQNNSENNNSFNICNYPYQNPNKHQQNSQSLISHDLTFAPQIIHFYNRKTELEILSNWILNQNIRLISVLGLSGIGKTTLIKKFVDLNLEKFQIIIWKNLKFPNTLESSLNEILTTCHQEPQDNISDKIKQISALLTKKKSLIILDDIQNLFISGELAGQYQTQYLDYQNWFKTLTESQHQSTMILISQEQCPEMHCLDKELYPIKCLELSGLNNTEILENENLKDPENWPHLINLYQGNPKYIQDVTILIKDFFDDSVAEFLAENQLILTNQMRSHFKQLFTKLSPLEQQLALELSKFKEPVVRETLKQNLNWSSTDFINALESLQKRYLIIKIKADKTQFDLSPIFKEYVKTLDK